MEENPETVSVFANTDVAVLRSGKAKKTDPPIPADLAPISGSGKRVRKEEPKEEEPVFLDPIRFRYSTEAVVDEEVPQAAEEPADTQAAEQRSANRKRRRRPKAEVKPEPKAEAPKESKPAPKQEKKTPKPAPKPAAKEAPKETSESAPKEAGEAKKPHRRRPNYRRRPNKPKQNPEG